MAMSDNASKNRDHWNDVAKNNSYDTKPWQKKIINQITEDLHGLHQWLGLEAVQASDESTKNDGKSVRLLDYACGPGTISNALKPYITSSVGMDLAPGMVKEYNRRASEAGLTHFHAILGDLCSTEGVAEDLKDESLYNFDIAAIGMGFHHFEHLQLSINRLVERLRPGGVLFIVDLIDRHGDQAITGDQGKGDNFMKEAARTVPHKHGFTREQMKGMYDAAGCQDFDFVELERPAIMGEGESTFEKKIFVAKAAKA